MKAAQGRGGLLLALLLAPSIAACTGTIASESPSTSVAPNPSAPASATPSPTPTASPSASPTAAAACEASALRATIVQSNGSAWQGAAGSRFAAFTLTNTGAAVCSVPAASRPKLLNGDGAVLIDGGAPKASALVAIQPGASLTTNVRTANLCAAPAIVAPVRVAFVLDGASGSVVAEAASPSDTQGVPPCLGDATKPSGEIEMDGWKPAS